MSTSKHIDKICIAVLALTLAIAILFMNGEALGIAVMTDGDEGNGMFTANDLDADWDISNATRIALDGGDCDIQGGGAYAYNGDVHIVQAGRYAISGTLDDGSVIVDANDGDKIWILLDDVSLHREDSAAFMIEQAGKVFLTLAAGTENMISSGAGYSEDAVASKIDGAVYSRDDLTINGGGSLKVVAEYKHGIVGNDDLVITGGSIDIAAPQDGIHVHDAVRIADADIIINAGDDGITVSNDEETSCFYMESGSVSIPSCYEGIEAIDITIAGGTVDIRPTDDGINANGRGGGSIIRITGGDITIINEHGRDADGLDSNGSIDISGGSVFISVNTSSYALDYGSENGGTCKVSGGIVIAAGGSAMAEGFDSSSSQAFVMYDTPTAAAGTVVTLEDEAGNTLASKAIPCAFSSVVISVPELELGETCVISVGDSSEEITVDNSSSSNGFGVGGMFGGRPGGDGFGRGKPDGGMSGGRGGGGRSGSRPDAYGTEPADSRQADPSKLSAGTGRGGPGGDMPEPTEGGSGGDMQEPPDGGFRGEAPQMPDGNFIRGGTGRGGFDGDAGDLSYGNSGSDLDAGSLIAVGISAAVLIAGIVFAFGYKRRG